MREWAVVCGSTHRASVLDTNTYFPVLPVCLPSLPATIPFARSLAGCLMQHVVSITAKDGATAPTLGRHYGDEEQSVCTSEHIEFRHIFIHFLSLSEGHSANDNFANPLVLEIEPIEDRKSVV